MRAVRQALPDAAVASRSQCIIDAIARHEAWASAREIALFWPMLARKEVDLRALDALGRQQGKRLWYPSQWEQGERSFTGFRLSERAEELIERGHRFAEPPASAPLAQPGQLGLVVVPALAAAPDGQRLGYGAGWYDATLGEFCPPAVAMVVTFDFQLVVELPSLPHDLAVQWVVTDRRVLRAGSAAL